MMSHQFMAGIINIVLIKIVDVDKEEALILDGDARTRPPTEVLGIEE